MSYNNPLPSGVRKLISISCAVLFMAFSFFYLYKMEGDLLSEAQFVFSKGVTRYSLLIGAIIITVVLYLLQWLISKLISVPVRLYAFTYFPSFLSLALLTHINRSVFHDFTFGLWKWIYPLLFIGSIVLMIMSRKLADNDGDSSDNTVFRYLWPNYLILLIFMIVTGWMQPASDVYHYELRTEALIMEGKYDDALEVGKTSLATSSRLNTLRSFALAKTGKLGENLFDYPQSGISHSLIEMGDSLQFHRFTSQDICAEMGAAYDSTIHTASRYIELMLRKDSLDDDKRNMLVDYMLCGYLLNKDIKRFQSALPIYYHSVAIENLPKSYREAVVMSAADTSSVVSPTYSRYNDYCHIRDSISSPLPRRNYLRRQFGNTYWWYYDYGK